MSVNRKGRGTAREHAAIKLLESLGHECTRSAASEGPVDIVAMQGHIVRLIQVKSREDGVRPSERQAAIEAMADLPSGVCTVSREVWEYYKDGRAWVLIVVQA